MLRAFIRSQFAVGAAAHFCLIIANVYAEGSGSLIDRGSLVRRITDGSLNPVVRSSSFTELCQLEASERDAGLRDIIRSMDASFAPTASASAIVNGDETAINLIVENLKNFSESGRIELLASPNRSHFTGRFREIPRQVMRNVIDGVQSPEDHGESKNNSVNIAAAILATSSEGDDLDLIARALPIASNAHGVWLALASNNRITTREIGIAQSVYVDVTKPLIGRVAAAVAISKNDKSAEQFAVNEIRQYLVRYCDRDMSQRLREQSAVGQVMSSEEIQKLRIHLRLLGMLRLLEADVAEPVVFEGIASCNEPSIRRVLAIVGVLRWPQRFCDLDRSTWEKLDAPSLNSTLAILVHYHPELRSAVATKFPGAVIDELLEAIRKNSPSAVSMEARIALSGW